MLVADFVGVSGALDELGYAVHGARAVERYDGGDILYALRLEAGAHGGHAGAFKLEHAACLSGGDHIEHRLVSVGDLFDLEIGLGLAHHLGSVLEHREVSQAEEVHLQQPQLLKGRHLILRDDGFIVFRQRHIFIDRPVGYHDARRVHTRVAGHALKRLGDVY